MPAALTSKHDPLDPNLILEHELIIEFGERLSADMISREAASSFGEFSDAKIKDYVPLLASRRARAHLRSLGKVAAIIPRA
jgi:hypothetical protein